MFFKFNLRYPTPALVLGLALLPLAASSLRWRRMQAVVGGVFALVLLATQLDPAVWPTRPARQALRRHPRRRHRAGGGRDRRCRAGGRAAVPAAAPGPPGGRRGAGRGRGFRAGGLRRPAPLPERALRQLGADAEHRPLGTRRVGLADRDRRLLHPVPARGARLLEPRGLRGASRPARRLRPTMAHAQSGGRL